jgi:hypothetical protein
MIISVTWPRIPTQRPGPHRGITPDAAFRACLPGDTKRISPDRDDAGPTVQFSIVGEYKH